MSTPCHLSSPQALAFLPAFPLCPLTITNFIQLFKYISALTSVLANATSVPGTFSFFAS